MSFVMGYVIGTMATGDRSCISPSVIVDPPERHQICEGKDLKVFDVVTKSACGDTIKIVEVVEDYPECVIQQKEHAMHTLIFLGVVVSAFLICAFVQSRWM